MATRKRNEFLDIPDSEDEGSERGYDSEAAEEEKSKGRALKRRRMESAMGLSDDDDDNAEGSEGESEEESRSRTKSKKAKQTQDNDDDDDASENENEDEDEDEDDDNDDYLNKTTTFETKKSSADKKPLKPLDKTKPPKKNKTGVVYFSSLPPYLKPFALKSLLEARGFEPITKVFLTPESATSGAPRKRSNKRKTYADGWVEFASKKTAKICAETLNASIVGGRKGGWYHDDVWNMKYLRGFKWADLMEQVQRERGEREARRRVEDARARKEEKVFLSGVEKGRVLDGITKKNEEKKKRNGDGGARKVDVKPRMLFKQNEVKHGRDKLKAGDDRAALADDTKRVLGKIF
ncbi:hypothetical protein ASPWEDRAFT_182460 [Aspergillus wentii DTO 134E9]|uniref:Pre-rRNA-processing protein ESF2 n=1 Tax=Aspergillus wentii DTO 134E9 TaxID=1073089 RepID=A0A1L9RRV7_ASPWE|nr:uncharacterized protein ASPWEDRAFT_182460 [Aspergillus wentii DTO 134E9]KAI9930445.1 RNA-binding ATPase activator esf2 [Aspergillus wentii]OJJ37603.1 hypothetical protein ASPWEDRAFT_182460 [Aspergillus wentii DTO 134E9]